STRRRCGGRRSGSERENPGDQVIDFFVRPLDLLVLFFLAVHLHLGAGGHVRMELLGGIGLALALAGNLLVGRAVLLLVERVALEAVVLLQQGPGSVAVGGLGGQRQTDGGEQYTDFFHGLHLLLGCAYMTPGTG